MWFEDLTGFREESPDQVRANIHVDGNTLTSDVNGRRMACGRLEIPTLTDLRARVHVCNAKTGSLKFSEVVGDVQALHRRETSAGALFQVASQFNLLEMTHPSVTPEQGVGILEDDHTQGPACAIACGAGTIYRTYFVEVNGQVGQAADRQIDCLRDLGAALENSDGRLWRMRNGYALATAEGLRAISEVLARADEPDRDALRQLLRIGIQWDTQVTLDDAAHTVSQAYCSALPVGYSDHPAELWGDFARLVLEASYEAALSAAVLNATRTGNNRVFLTLLGGGVFANCHEWIFPALDRALRIVSGIDLDVAVVSHGESNDRVRDLVEAF
jgi:hypothetical protein